jgi:DNA-binding transcriptional MerR regulator
VSIFVAPRALLTKRELADFLRCSVRTVDRLRERGLIEPVQPVARGGVRYRVEDIERLVVDPELRSPLPVRTTELEWK